MSEEEATEALLARLSYSATIRISKAIPFTPSNKLTVFQTAWLSLPFGFLVRFSNSSHCDNFLVVFILTFNYFHCDFSGSYRITPCTLLL